MKRSGWVPVYLAPVDICVLSKVERLIRPLRRRLRRKDPSMKASEALYLAVYLSVTNGALQPCLALSGKREDHVRVAVTSNQLRILWALGFCRDEQGRPLVSDDGYLMCAPPRDEMRGRHATTKRLGGRVRLQLQLVLAC